MAHREGDDVPKRLIGTLAAAGYLICFFGLPLVDGCDGGEVLEIAMDDAAPEVWKQAGALLVGGLLCAVVAGVAYMAGRLRVGSWAGAGAGASLVTAYVVAGVESDNLDNGAYLLMLLAATTWLAAVLPIPDGRSGVPPSTHGSVNSRDAYAPEASMRVRAPELGRMLCIFGGLLIAAFVVPWRIADGHTLFSWDVLTESAAPTAFRVIAGLVLVTGVACIVAGRAAVPRSTQVITAVVVGCGALFCLLLASTAMPSFARSAKGFDWRFVFLLVGLPLLAIGQLAELMQANTRRARLACAIAAGLLLAAYLVPEDGKIFVVEWFRSIGKQKQLGVRVAMIFFVLPLGFALAGLRVGLGVIGRSSSALLPWLCVSWLPLLFVLEFLAGVAGARDLGAYVLRAWAVLFHIPVAFLAWNALAAHGCATLLNRSQEGSLPRRSEAAVGVEVSTSPERVEPADADEGDAASVDSLDASNAGPAWATGRIVEDREPDTPEASVRTGSEGPAKNAARPSTVDTAPGDRGIEAQPAVTRPREPLIVMARRRQNVVFLAAVAVAMIGVFVAVLVMGGSDTDGRDPARAERAEGVPTVQPRTGPTDVERLAGTIAGARGGAGGNCPWFERSSGEFLCVSFDSAFETARIHHVFEVGEQTSEVLDVRGSGARFTDAVATGAVKHPMIAGSSATTEAVVDQTQIVFRGGPTLSVTTTNEYQTLSIRTEDDTRLAFARCQADCVGLTIAAAAWDPPSGMAVVSVLERPDLSDPARPAYAGEFSFLVFHLDARNSDVALAAPVPPPPPPAVGVVRTSGAFVARKATGVAITAPLPSVEASSHLPDWNYRDVAYTFVAVNTVDGRLDTCWQEGDKAGPGIGHYLHYQFDKPVRLTAIGIANGFQLTGDPQFGNLFRKNSRLEEVTIEINGTEVGTFAVEDATGWVYMDVDAARVDSVRLVIAAVYAGSKWQDTSVSEVRFFGEVEEVAGIPGGVLDAPPPPPPPPPATGKPKIVPQNVLEQLRISGEKSIRPDRETITQIERSGQSKVVATLKMCVSTGGRVTSVSLLKSSGYPAYDRKLQSGIEQWKFRPYVVDGQSSSACTAWTFIYKQT